MRGVRRIHHVDRMECCWHIPGRWRLKHPLRLRCARRGLRNSGYFASTALAIFSAPAIGRSVVVALTWPSCFAASIHFGVIGSGGWSHPHDAGRERRPQASAASLDHARREYPEFFIGSSYPLVSAISITRGLSFIPSSRIRKEKGLSSHFVLPLQLALAARLGQRLALADTKQIRSGGFKMTGPMVAARWRPLFLRHQLLLQRNLWRRLTRRGSDQ